MIEKDILLRRGTWAVILGVKPERANGGGWFCRYGDVYGMVSYSPEEAMQKFDAAMIEKSGSYMGDVARGLRQP